jgi:hypothetical protein
MSLSNVHARRPSVVSVESDQQGLEGKMRNVRNQEVKRLLTALYGVKCRMLCYDKFLQVRPGRWIEKHAAATDHQSEKSNFVSDSRSAAKMPR